MRLPFRMWRLGHLGRSSRLLFQAPILLEKLIEIAGVSKLANLDQVQTGFHGPCPMSAVAHILLTDFDLAIPRRIRTFSSASNGSTLPARLITRAFDFMGMASQATVYFVSRPSLELREIVRLSYTRDKLPPLMASAFVFFGGQRLPFQHYARCHVDPAVIVVFGIGWCERWWKEWCFGLVRRCEKLPSVRRVSAVPF